MLGVIGGQVINAWREGARWRRDQKREDLRWARERERERLKLEHESTLDLREKRIDLYIEVLGTLREAVDLLLRLTPDDSDDVDLSLIGGELSSFYNQFRASKVKLDIIGSPELRERSWEAQLSILTALPIKAGEKISYDKSESYIQGIIASYHRLLETIRQELGIDAELAHANNGKDEG